MLYWIVFNPLLVNAQITFSELLSLREKNYQECQSILFKENKCIENKKSYQYNEVVMCDPLQYFEDSCRWKCTAVQVGSSMFSEFPLSDIPFKNYQMFYKESTLFAENYNPTNETATTFINVENHISGGNDNCKNELVTYVTWVNLNIQFSDEDHWNAFKSSVVKQCQLRGTFQYANDRPVNFKYEIKLNPNWSEMIITLTEDPPLFFADVDMPVPKNQRP